MHGDLYPLIYYNLVKFIVDMVFATLSHQKLNISNIELNSRSYNKQTLLE